MRSICPAAARRSHRSCLVGNVREIHARVRIEELAHDVDDAAHAAEPKLSFPGRARASAMSAARLSSFDPAFDDDEKGVCAIIAAGIKSPGDVQGSLSYSRGDRIGGVDERRGRAAGADFAAASQAILPRAGAVLDDEGLAVCSVIFRAAMRV